MALTVFHKQQALRTSVSIFSSQRDVQLAINALSPDFTVRCLCVTFWIVYFLSVSS